MPPTEPQIYLLATLDTKAAESVYLRDRLRQLGASVQLVDTGCIGPAVAAADISREDVFAAAGLEFEEVLAKADRGYAVTQAAAGAAKLIAQRHAAGQVAGVLGIGGSAGTTIGTAAMRALPLGVPKVMISTLAAGQVRQFVGAKDIFMLSAVTDLAGLNRISRVILDQAARAMAGLVTLPADRPSSVDRPLIAASMFGVTTPAVEAAKKILDAAGYEVLVFHATGAGGQAMESLIAEGLVAGVLDLTTTELADELVGGFLSAGPERLTAAARAGVPQVVSVGATDMVNFYGPESVPPQFAARKFYQHNANVTLMRTTPEENAAIGVDIGRKLSQSRGPVSVLFPRQGVSAIDRAGQPFDDPAARQALLEALRGNLPAIKLIEIDAHINDGEFAAAAAEKLLELMRSVGQVPRT